MKRCPKSETEPPGLASFRRQHPDASWEQFQNEAQRAYGVVVTRLSTEQGGLCAYCEFDLVPVSDQAVEHFHPKSDPSAERNWHLAWDNLLLCCQGGQGLPTPESLEEGRTRLPRRENLSCDARKGSRILDDRILNPLHIPAFPRLFRFLSDGTIEVDEDLCRQAGVDSEMAGASIESLGLNCPRLRDALAATLRGIERQVSITRIRDGSTPGRAYASLVSRHLAKNDTGRWNKFFTLIRWRFRQAAEDHLRTTDYSG